MSTILDQDKAGTCTASSGGGLTEGEVQDLIDDSILAATRSYSRQTPTTGFTISMAGTLGTLQLTPAGTLASGTVNLPASPVDGQIASITSTQAITALTIGAGSNSLVNTIAGMPAHGFVSWQYNASGTSWQIIRSSLGISGVSAPTSYLVASNGSAAASIGVAGSDAHINLNLSAKGAGGINIGAFTLTGSGLFQVGAVNVTANNAPSNGLHRPTTNTVSMCNNFLDTMRWLPTVSSVNYLTAQGSATTGAVTLGAGGSDSNISIALTPKGTGTLNVASDIVMTAATAGMTLRQGANGRVGTFTLNEATPVTVNNTSISITDCIVISLNTVGGTVGNHPNIMTITAATGFTVAGSIGDTSTYNYAIIKNSA